jgi:hypothetical protein
MADFFQNKTKYLALALAMALLTPAFATAQVSWAKNFDEAVKQAAKENKFVILDISATW